MAATNQSRPTLALKLPLTEIDNIIELANTKTIILKINDQLHNDACTTYCAVYIDASENYDDIRRLELTPLQKPANIIIASPAAYDNSEQ